MSFFYHRPNRIGLERLIALARPYKIPELEDRHGDLHKVIPPLANKHGQNEAARILGISQSTVSHWLKSNGYKQIRQWVKDAQTA